jgi:two-component system sensor histidine kinase MtrB
MAVGVDVPRTLPLRAIVERWRPERWRPGRLGLRSRVILSFALGAFVLSTLLAAFTFAFTRSTLLRQREEAVVRQAYVNARQIQDSLRSDPVSVPELLSGLGLPGGSRPLVCYRTACTALSSEYTQAILPDSLKARVGDDLEPARMRYPLNGRVVLAVGIPLPAVAATYYEVVPLDDIGDTLRSVGVSLIGAAVITTAFGVLLGVWSSRRVVRPLADAAAAAKAIAGGRLDTRLEPTDDSDLRALTSAFNDMAVALQDRVERDARFASDVSHELRSPLMTLSASIEVMQARRDDLPERAQAALDLLSSDVKRFQGLVEDLLEISRYDAGSIRLLREEILAGEFVRQAVAVSSLPETPVTVSERAEHLVLDADRRRLARAVANLIDNARVYGGEHVEVTVDIPPEEGEPIGHVLIAVADDGPGVPPEERQLVFQRFARGTVAGRRGAGEGAGLGLALVEEHVRLHGGRVWVEDRADDAPGARFVIELPAEDL